MFNFNSPSNLSNQESPDESACENSDGPANNGSGTNTPGLSCDTMPILEEHSVEVVLVGA